MSYLFPRNVGGFTTVGDLLVNELQIQTQAIGGFSIYVNDPTNPLFSVDGSTGTITTRGTLNVLGTASFTTIEISETKQSLFELASANSTSDLVDIGIYGEYNSGTGSLFGSAFRNSADAARRWFFIKDIAATPPLTNIPSFTSANFVGVVADNYFTNSGLVSAPSYSFYTSPDSGMYSVSSNTIGFAVRGVAACTLANTGSAINVTFPGAATTIFYSLAGTTNDIASSAGGGITTGSTTLQSSGLADKWQHYISTNPASAYAGEIFSFGSSNHYFITNNGSNLQFSYTTQTLSAATAPPDYRSTSKINIFGINTNYLSTAVPIIATSNGTASAPMYSFSSDIQTGIFQSTTSTLSLSSAGTKTADITATAIYPYCQILMPSGSLSSPYYSFSNYTTTGIYRNVGAGIENISISLGGNIGGAFILSSATTPQLQMPLGTSMYPSFTFGGGGATGTGFYSPQVGGATQGLISVASNLQDTWIFKNRSTNTTIGGGNHLCLNALDVLPGGTDAIVTGRLNAVSSKFIGLKSNAASFEGFNLIDSVVLLFYRFNMISALGTDSSESTSPINGVATGHVPGYQTTVSDGTLIKKYVLDLTLNSASPGMYLNLNAAVSTFSSVNTFSLSFWFKCVAVPSPNGTILNFKNTSTLKNINIAVLNGSDAIEVVVESTSLTKLQFNTQGVAIKDGRWHHIVLLLGTGGSKFYLDNVQLIYAVGLNYTSGGNGVPTANYATNTLSNLVFDKITIGGQHDGVSFTSYFTGYLYSIYMSAATITVAQIAALYNEGSISTYSIDVTNLNVSSQTSAGQITVGDGSAAAPAYSFQSETSSGLYKIGAGNIGLSVAGANILDINASRLSNAGLYVANNGVVGGTSYGFGTAGYGMYFASSAVFLAAGSTNILKGTSSGAIVPYGAGSTSLIFQRAGGNEVTNKLYVDGSDNLFIQNTSGSGSTIATFTSGNTGLQIRKTSSTAAFSITNDAGSSTLLVADTVNSQLKSFNGTAVAPGYSFMGDATTGLYLIGAGNIGLSIGGIKYIDINTTRSAFVGSVYFADGNAAAPSLAFSSASSNGFYYMASNLINVANAGVQTWQFSPLGTTHVSYNALTIAANGTTTAVSIGSLKLIATATQTLLNSNSIVEFNFITTNMSVDSSINNYTGGTNGTVSRVTSAITLNPIGSGGLINYYAMGLATGANGIYTNASMVEMTSATFINITLNIMFPTGSAITGNCWVLYGNYTAPTQNYIRLYVVAGVLSISCLSGSTTIIQASYSTMAVDKWYRIEFATYVTGNKIYINGVDTTTSFSYTTGTSATTFSFNAQILDKSAIHTYLGGGINSYSAPNCYINYFSIIQLNSIDTVAVPYRGQIHELYTNKLVVSGYPYNNDAANLNEGSIAISNKVGQLQWNNSLQVYSDNIVVNKYLYLQGTSINTGAVKYSIVIDPSASINLASSPYTNSHYLKLTAGTIVITLPTGSAQSGREYVFIYKGTPGSVTINKSVGSSDIIGGSASFLYSGPTGAIFRIIYDGASEWIFI